MTTVRRRRKRKKIRQKIVVERENGYYWLKVKRPNGTEQWIIGRWWNSLQFFDTMSTIMEIGHRDKIIEINENKIQEPIKRRRTK